MNWLEREKELEELRELLKQEKEEELNPDWQQYLNLKWKINSIEN